MDRQKFKEQKNLYIIQPVHI